MEKKLPTFEFVIDDSAETGVKAISIVADPAFRSEFVTFGKAPKPIFVELEKKKRICAGLSLIPNVPIYRFDEVFGEYYGYFSPETIEKIVEKYHEEMNQNKVNVNHDHNDFIDAFLVEDYIVNSDARAEDLKSKGIEHPNIMGAWYTAFKIKDELDFERIVQSQKEGNGTGFSVEAFLDKVIVSMMKSERQNFENKMKEDKKNLLEKIVALFKSDEDKMERALVPELAIEIEWGGVGEPVQQVIVGEDGQETLQPLAPGEYITDMGVIIVDETGLVEIREVPAEEEPVEEPDVSMEEPKLQEEEPVEEAPVEEPVIEEEPVVEEEPVIEEEPVVEEEDVMSTLTNSLLESNGTHYLKVTVEGGKITAAELSDDTFAEFTRQIEDFEKKMEDPIEEPKLEPSYKTKDFKDMNTYEKVMYRRSLEK